MKTNDKESNKKSVSKKILNLRNPCNPSWHIKCNFQFIQRLLRLSALLHLQIFPLLCLFLHHVHIHDKRQFAGNFYEVLPRQLRSQYKFYDRDLVSESYFGGSFGRDCVLQTEKANG